MTIAPILELNYIQKKGGIENLEDDTEIIQNSLNGAIFSIVLILIGYLLLIVTIAINRQY